MDYVHGRNSLLSWSEIVGGLSHETGRKKLRSLLIFVSIFLGVVTVWILITASLGLWVTKAIAPGLIAGLAPADTGNDQIFLVPATSLWMNSGIKVEKNTEVNLQVSGSVNTAAHRMFWAAMTDTTPSVRWVRYPGEDLDDAVKRSSSEKNRLHWGSPNGSLLMYVCQDKEKCPSVSDPRVDQDRIIPITSSTYRATRTSNYPIDHSGLLYFAINDHIPTSVDEYYDDNIDERIERMRKVKEEMASQQAAVTITAGNLRDIVNLVFYFNGRVPEDQKDYKKIQKSKWEALGDDVNRLWYDDNAGYYLLRVKTD